MLCIRLELQAHLLCCCNYCSLISYVVVHDTQVRTIFCCRHALFTTVDVRACCMHVCQVEGEVRERRICGRHFYVCGAQICHCDCTVVQCAALHIEACCHYVTRVSVNLRLDANQVARIYPILTSSPCILIVVRSIGGRGCCTACCRCSGCRCCCISGCSCCIGLGCSGFSRLCGRAYAATNNNLQPASRVVLIITIDIVLFVLCVCNVARTIGLPVGSCYQVVDTIVQSDVVYAIRCILTYCYVEGCECQLIRCCTQELCSLRLTICCQVDVILARNRCACRESRVPMECCHFHDGRNLCRLFDVLILQNSSFCFCIVSNFRCYTLCICCAENRLIKIASAITVCIQSCTVDHITKFSLCCLCPAGELQLTGSRVNNRQTVFIIQSREGCTIFQSYSMFCNLCALVVQIGEGKVLILFITSLINRLPSDRYVVDVSGRIELTISNDVSANRECVISTCQIFLCNRYSILTCARNIQSTERKLERRYGRRSSKRSHRKSRYSHYRSYK